MSLPRFILFCLWVLLAPGWAVAQQNPPRCRWVVPNWQADSAGYAFTFTPDTLSLVPDSIWVGKVGGAGPKLAASDRVSFYYDLNANTLRLFVPGSARPDSVLICYRVLPYLLTKKIFRRDQAKYDSGSYDKPNSYIPPRPDDGQTLPSGQPREELFSYGGLQKSGSITRGISFGNRQDVVVQSALNLQLEGKISDEIHLTAVLTDQNVPFQPEGNTQQLQQFDRVFIKLVHPLVSLSAGDIVLQTPSALPRPGNIGSPPSQFLRYYKNVLGAMAETTYGADSGRVTKGGQLLRARTRVAVAAAKGRFYSQIVPVQEGVLGPYRLRGPGNERFIIILANSERVYLDNRLLTRGFNYDYVIDYNTAEITFTNRVVITRFSRVRIDFEYNVQSYSRGILVADHHQEIGKWSFFGQFYRERDNPNNPLLANLDTAGRRILAAIGDSLDLAVAPSAQPVANWEANRILYTQRDTTVGGRTYEVFVRANQPQPSLFSLVFSEVGPGRGDYVPGSPTANGREYVWVAPQNNVPQGNYAPVRQLPAPNERQMITAGTAYQINKSEKIFGEAAFSRNDPNLYSTVNNENQRAWAVKLGYANTGKPLNQGRLKAFEWSGALDLEHDQPNFNPIDRFRAIEFDRDWSVDFQAGALDLALNTSPSSGLGSPVAAGQPVVRQATVADQIVNASLGLRKTTGLGNPFLNLRHSRRQRGQEVNGFQQAIDGGFNVGKFLIQTNYSVMRNQLQRSGLAYLSTWDRWRVEVAYRAKKLVPGYAYAVDRNAIRRTANDSVAATAMNYAEHRFYLRNGDSTKWLFNADYSLRNDFLPREGRLALANRANTVNVSASRKTSTQFFSLIATYRNLANLTPGLVGSGSLPNDETITGRLDWNANFWQNAIRSELTLQNGSGRELRREFTFLAVNPGQGTHAWRDDNGDGVQQLNEFYLAINPDERNFIKIFTPTDLYINAFTNNFSYRLNAGFPKSWIKAKGFKQFAARFSNVSSWTINKRFTDRQLLPRFLPVLPVSDSLLLSNQDIFRSALFYQRTNPKFGADVALLVSEQKQLLTNGFEGRQQREWQAGIRYNLSAVINARLTFVADQRGNRSDFMPNRNYRVAQQQWRPELAWQPNPNFRLTGIYERKDKRNVQGDETAVFNEMSLDVRWAKEGQRTVNARLRYANINYTGETNTPTGYEMLEALRNGRNLNWSVVWQQRLSNGLQLNLQYEGRSSVGQAVIHLGRMQVTALF